LFANVKGDKKLPISLQCAHLNCVNSFENGESTTRIQLESSGQFLCALSSIRRGGETGPSNNSLISRLGRGGMYSVSDELSSLTEFGNGTIEFSFLK